MRRNLLVSSVSALVLLAGCAQTPIPAATPVQDQPSLVSASPDSPSAKALLAQTPTPTASAAPTMMIKAGAADPKVKELQARLRQLGLFAPYDVVDKFGPATVTALKSFQAQHGMPPTGDLDSATWAALTAATKAPTTEELANQVPGPDVVGPGSGKVNELQARLSQLSYFIGTVDGKTYPTAGVKKFQARRGIPVTGTVDQRTWDALTARTRKPTADELAGKSTTVPVGSAASLPAACTKYDRVICARRSTRQLAWVVGGKILMRLDIRFGMDKPGFETHNGDFTVQWKDADHYSHTFNADMLYSMFFDNEGRAVHYSKDFARRGYRGASHGCLNTRDLAGTAKLFSMVEVGDHVVIVP